MAKQNKSPNYVPRPRPTIQATKQVAIYNDNCIVVIDSFTFESHVVLWGVATYATHQAFPQTPRHRARQEPLIDIKKAVRLTTQT